MTTRDHPAGDAPVLSVIVVFIAADHLQQRGGLIFRTPSRLSSPFPEQPLLAAASSPHGWRRQPHGAGAAFRVLSHAMAWRCGRRRKPRPAVWSGFVWVGCSRLGSRRSVGAIAGMLVAPSSISSQHAGVLLYAFAAALVGGMTIHSVRSGGFAVGVLENLIGAHGSAPSWG